MDAADLPGVHRHLHGTDLPCPPVARCAAHGSPHTVLLVGWTHRDKQSVWPDFSCPVCAVTHPWAIGIAAVWDGHTWVGPQDCGTVFVRAYRAATATSGDGDGGSWGAVEVVEAGDHPDSVLLRRARVWTYLLANPGITAGEASRLLSQAGRVLECRHEDPPEDDPWHRPAADLQALVERSRVRWQHHQGVLWGRLGASTRDAVAHLAREPLSGRDLETLPAAAVTELGATVDALWAATPADQRPSGGDNSMWGRRVNDYWFNDQIRALASWVHEHDLDQVDTPSPLADPATRPRFGPRTAALEALLTRAATLTDLEQLCVRLALPSPVPFGATPRNEAMSRAHTAVSRHLLGYASSAAHRAFWPVSYDVGLVAVADASKAELATDLIDPVDVATLSGPFEAGLAAAAAISGHGPAAVQLALELAADQTVDWGGDVHAFARAVVDAADEQR